MKTAVLAVACCLLCVGALAASTHPGPKLPSQQAKAAATAKGAAAARAAAAVSRRTAGAARVASSARAQRQLALKLPADKELRVWCIGDSITQGWLSSSQTFHPYTIALQHFLSNRLPAGYKITFVNSGVGGAGIQDVISSEVQSMQAQPFDVAIVMGGINDVKWRLRQAGPVFDTLKGLYNSIDDKTGAVILAVPPLPTKLCGDPSAWGCDINEQRKALRAMIMNYASTRAAALSSGAAASGPRIALLDEESRFQYWALPAGTRDSLFDDDVHLSAQGYDQLGRDIGAKFCDIYPEMKC